MKYFFPGLLGMIFWVGAVGQPAYRLVHFSSAHNCFPDTARASGHLDGDKIQQPKAGHYDDSTVLLVIPPGLDVGKSVDLVFWFHGWHNNIDTAVRFYALADQLAESGRNAILVLPEAAKNAADSYGGKMRQDGMFKSLVVDVVEELKREGVVPREAVSGHVVLAGHSGAYSVIADILDHGQQPVDEVFLFDALYGHVDTYMRWATAGDEHHFVHWFTNTGYGPDEMSDTMMFRLQQSGYSYGLCEEGSVNRDILGGLRILFIHSPRTHNVIVNNPDDFAVLLRNSYFLGKTRWGADTLQIREIHVSHPEGDLVYPIVVGRDTAVSRAINRSIREQVLPEGPGGVRVRIGAWIKEDKLDELDYTVTRNLAGVFSLSMHSEEGGGPLIRKDFYMNFSTRDGRLLGIGDLIASDKLDSFRNMVLTDKRRYLRAYMDSLERAKIDSDDFGRIREWVSDCRGQADLSNFSISPTGIEIMDGCGFGNALRGYEPDYSLVYPFWRIEWFLKKENP